jgi:hypothetical protein
VRTADGARLKLTVGFNTEGTEDAEQRGEAARDAECASHVAGGDNQAGTVASTYRGLLDLRVDSDL